MFDFTQIFELIKIEPGHGGLQSALLFMIWMSSRGLKKEMHALRDAMATAKSMMEDRFNKLEHRIDALELRGK